MRKLFKLITSLFPKKEVKSVVLEHLNKFDLISLEYIKIDRNGEFKVIEQSKRTY